MSNSPGLPTAEDQNLEIQSSVTVYSIEVVGEEPEENALNDEHYYCEICHILYVDQCEVHGPPLFTYDSPTPVGFPQRALLTLPKGLVIGRSTSPGAALGVFNQGQVVPQGMHFGPFDGEVTSMEKALESPYSWLIYRGGDHYDCIDAERDTHSNWMKYVACSQNEKEQNLVAFQQSGRILFRCCRPILPGQELKVWYAEDYAQNVSPTWDEIWDRKCNPTGRREEETQVFNCLYCQYTFPATSYLHRHVRRSHPDEYSQLPEPEAPEPIEQIAVMNLDQCLLASDAPSSSETQAVIEPFQSQVPGSDQAEKPGPAEMSHSQNNNLSDPTDQTDDSAVENKCSECRRTFLRACHLKRHERTIHSKEKPYCCSHCRKCFSQATGLKRHQQTHQDKEDQNTDTQEETEAVPTDIYPCTECSFSFVAKINLYKHLKRHHHGEYLKLVENNLISTDISLNDNDISDKHDPLYEPTTRLRRSTLSRNRGRGRPKKGLTGRPRGRPPKSKKKAVPKPVKKRVQEQSQSPCSESGQITTGSEVPQETNAEDKQSQEEAVLPHTCGECLTTFERLDLLEGHECIQQGDGLHGCSNCGLYFNRRCNLQRHERNIHAKEKPYCCTLCLKSFTQSSGLKRHQESHSRCKTHSQSMTENSASLYSCSHCPFSFTGERYLYKHVRRHHPEMTAKYLSFNEGDVISKEHSCTQCSKIFRTIRGFKNHTCFRQGDQQYLCPDCGKAFSWFNSLKQHQRIHSGVKPYMCSQCEKSFVHAGQLNVHMRTHTGEKPFLCAECGESFRQSGDLRRHEQKHSGMRPCQCPDCGKSFSRPQSLKAHQQLHKGAKLFPCTQCGKSFARRYHLTRHHQKMHSGRLKRKEVNTDHEVIKVEAGSTRCSTKGSPIKFSEIFSGNFRGKKVLTLGEAGIGKTVLVQKFALDWAEGKSNADIDFVFIISLRELNLLKDELYSLHELLTYLYPDLNNLNETGLYDGKSKCAFIFDGLDEFSKPLDFQQKKMLAVTQKATVDVLVTNLIKGALLPSALVWITSRPAAADQIPLNSIRLVTEVRGFTAQLKEEFFRKRTGDEGQARQIISDLKQSKTLYIMCYIPAFCWITYVVHQEMANVPKTLTQMYTCFLTIQLDKNDQKQNKLPPIDTKKLLESHKSLILKLSELAFKQLMKGNMMFFEEDLIKSGIDVTEASVYSGIFTGVLKKEWVSYQRKVYCFVHLTLQEFLAALYVFYCYENKNMEELQVFKPQNTTEWSENVPLDEILKGAVEKAVENQKGQLDIFLRFLLGISVESNQRLLQGLLTQTNSGSEKTTEYIRELIKGYNYIPTQRSMNLFLCLSEMNDLSLSREIQEFLENRSEEELSPAQCSALACMFLTSAEVLEELNLKKYRTNEEGYWRLIPAVSVCRKAVLAGCYVLADSCETLSSILQSENSSLTELDLSNNNLKDLGLELLSVGLKSSHCKLETIRLSGCNLTAISCEKLASCLQSVNSSLKELDLSNNNLQDSGVDMLSVGLMSSHCKLKTLRLASCNFTALVCEKLALSLQSENSYLKELDVSNNDLQDSGVELLFAGLKSSLCKLETLRLNMCNLGEKACAVLGSALQLGNISLKELDLSNNDLQDMGVKRLSDGLKILRCELDIIRLSGCMLTEKSCSSLASALKSNPFHLRELDLTYNNLGESGVKELSDLLEDPHYKLEKLHVDHGGMMRMKPGLKKYFCYLTLDPNTANRHLFLSERNRKVSWVTEDQLYPDHAERFVEQYPQVLSVESLTGRCYWEVECGGENEVDLSVAYRGIRRTGGSEECCFGHNDLSWSLNFYDSTDECFVCHRYQNITIPALHTSSKRVGVYLDWTAGTLSFYTITSCTQTLIHIHTFTNTFTEPLYAGIGLNENSSVRFCEIE